MRFMPAAAADFNDLAERTFGNEAPLDSLGEQREAMPETPVKADCPCPKLTCKLRGKCEECRAKHGRKGQLPRRER